MNYSAFWPLLRMASRSHRRCRTARPDLSERWPSRLVATAEEERLNFPAAQQLAVGGFAVRPLACCLCSPGLAFGRLRAVARELASQLSGQKGAGKPRIIGGVETILIALRP
jgi:hypothetical protein